MQTVGFIGLGNLGTPMAQNIQRAGFPMAVYDVREGATRALLEGGARLAASPAEVAAVSDVVMSCVPGPSEVEEITLGPTEFSAAESGRRVRGPLHQSTVSDPPDREDI